MRQEIQYTRIKWEIHFIVKEKSCEKTCSAFTPGLHSCCSCSRVAMPCSTLFGSISHGLLWFSLCSYETRFPCATTVTSLWYGCCCWCFKITILQKSPLVDSTNDNKLLSGSGWFQPDYDLWQSQTGSYDKKYSRANNLFSLSQEIYLQIVYSFTKM